MTEKAPVTVEDLLTITPKLGEGDVVGDPFSVAVPTKELQEVQTAAVGFVRSELRTGNVPGEEVVMAWLKDHELVEDAVWGEYSLGCGIPIVLPVRETAHDQLISYSHLHVVKRRDLDELASVYSGDAGQRARRRAIRRGYDPRSLDLLQLFKGIDAKKAVWFYDPRLEAGPDGYNMRAEPKDARGMKLTAEKTADFTMFSLHAGYEAMIALGESPTVTALEFAYARRGLGGQQEPPGKTQPESITHKIIIGVRRASDGPYKNVRLVYLESGSRIHINANLCGDPLEISPFRASPTSLDSVAAVESIIEETFHEGIHRVDFERTLTAAVAHAKDLMLAEKQVLSPYELVIRE